MSPTTRTAGAEDPRVTRSKAKILEATLEELVERGYADLSIEGVAEQAGVGKSTIYRHWETKASLVTDAMEMIKPEMPAPASGELREDLLAILRGILRMMTASRASSLLPILIEAAERDPELAGLHHDFVHARREPMRRVLQGAIARGAVPADLDVEVVADLLVGPLFYRRFVSREPVSEALAEHILDVVLSRLDALCGSVTPSVTRSGSRAR